MAKSKSKSKPDPKTYSPDILERIEGIALVHLPKRRPKEARTGDAVCGLLDIIVSIRNETGSKKRLPYKLPD